MVGIAFALVCGYVGRPHVTIQTIYHSISYHGRMSLFGFLEGRRVAFACLQVNTLWVYLTSVGDKHVLRKAEESRGR